MIQVSFTNIVIFFRWLALSGFFPNNFIYCYINWFDFGIHFKCERNILPNRHVEIELLARVCYPKLQIFVYIIFIWVYLQCNAFIRTDLKICHLIISLNVYTYEKYLPKFKYYIFVEVIALTYSHLWFIFQNLAHTSTKATNLLSFQICRISCYFILVNMIQNVVF